MPKKEKLEDITARIQETHIDPIDQRLKAVEKKSDEAKMLEWFESQFGKRMQHDAFRNKVRTLFNEFLHDETFLNKVDNRAKKVVDLHQWKRSAVIGAWVLSTVVAIILGGVIQRYALPQQVETPTVESQG